MLECEIDDAWWVACNRHGEKMKNLALETESLPSNVNKIYLSLDLAQFQPACLLSIKSGIPLILDTIAPPFPRLCLPY